MQVLLEKFLNSDAENSAVFFIKFGKSTVIQLIPDDFHEVVVEVEVVHDRQAHAEHFAAFQQMAQVGAREIPAGRTVAVLVDRALVELIFGVVEVAHAFPGEQLTVTCIAAGHHAVEQVDAAVYGFQDIES